MNSSPTAGSSHHFPADLSSWTHHARSKPSWQMARDMSMEILSRKATKLSYKPSNLTSASTTALSSSLKTTGNESGRGLTIPRMPTEKQAMDVTIAHKLSCSFCDGPCIGNYLRCRVCVKVYHSRCLYERNYINDEYFQLPRMGKQNWSCPECRDLTRLINPSELTILMQAFEFIDKNGDGFISLEEYLSFEPNKKLSEGLELFIQFNREVGKIFFRAMDAHQEGAVGWSDFALFYSCKLIISKNKVELTLKLTDKELVQAKTLFFKDPMKTFDNERNFWVTREHLRQVSHDLTELLKEKYGKDFIDAILDSEQNVVPTEPELVNWDEFLRETALLLLLNRANDGKMNQMEPRVVLPQHLINLPVVPRSSSILLPAVPLRSISRHSSLRDRSPYLPHLPDDRTFNKYATILAKLKQRDHDEEVRRKFTGSLVDYSIVESVDEEDDVNLPRLKPCARDDRLSVTDPWTAVKDIQRLRNQPILLRSIR